MTETVLEEQARRHEEAAAELERAAGHLRRSADHFRSANLASAHAHAFATYGHMLNAQAAINRHAVALASKSNLPGDPDEDQES